MRKIKRVTPLDAEEVIVDAALVAVIAPHDFHAGIGAADAERGLASVATMRADGSNVVHLPRARLVAVGARRERTNGADVDAHAALFALEVVVLIGGNDGTDAAVLHAQRPDVHGFAADSHAAITENAARTVEVHHRRPLLLFLVVLGLHELRLSGAVGERHVLQFALAAGIAYRTVKR